MPTSDDLKAARWLIRFLGGEGTRLGLVDERALIVARALIATQEGLDEVAEQGLAITRGHPTDLLQLMEYDR